MKRAFVLLAVAVFVPLLAGCGSGEKALGKSSDPAKETGKESHGSIGHTHEPRHGGVIQSVGDYHLELVHDARNGEISLYVMGSDEGVSAPIESKPLTAQVKREGDDELLSVELNPIPLAGESKGQSSRFAGTESQLAGKKPFEAILRVGINGKVYRTMFQVVPGETRQSFACPMDCEKGKVYAAAGKCPVCHMDLVHPQGAHADHNPKHGGVFFMAPNQWHHLEGVMPTENMFHLYLYDNFTKPISAKPFLEGSYVEAIQLNAEKREIGKLAKLTLSLSDDGTFLRATLPAGLRFPLSITARIKFEGRNRPEVFNFTFESISGEGKHDH